MNKILSNKRKGFTLLEVLLVVAIIAILAGIVILALSPGKQVASGNDSQRDSDVNTILNAVWQYSLNHDGNLPSGITAISIEICATDAPSCAELVDLTEITSGETFLESIPEDPFGGINVNGTGYTIEATSDGMIIVNAPQAENDSIRAARQ